MARYVESDLTKYELKLLLNSVLSPIELEFEFLTPGGIKEIIVNYLNEISIIESLKKKNKIYAIFEIKVNDDYCLNPPSAVRYALTFVFSLYNITVTLIFMFDYSRKLKAYRENGIVYIQ